MDTQLKAKGRTNLARILGIIGGLLGIAAGFLAIIVGGAGMLLAADMESIIWLGSIGVVMGAMGIFGGSIAPSRTPMAIALMIISGLGGFVAVSVFWLLPGALLLIGALVAWSAQTQVGPARV